MAEDDRPGDRAEGAPARLRRDRPDGEPRVLLFDRRDCSPSRRRWRSGRCPGIVRAGIGALDEIYETPETRPFWIRFPLSFGLAILVPNGDARSNRDRLGRSRLRRLGHRHLVLRWPAAAALIAFAFELIVRWGPDENRRVRWTSLGSVLVVVGWIGETLIFGAYVRSVANFRTAVGSLEVFIFLATYFYISRSFCSSRWSSTSSSAPTCSGRGTSRCSCRSSRV